MATSNAVLKGIKATWVDLLKPEDLTSNVDIFTTTVQSQSNEENYYISAANPGIKALLDEVTFSDVDDFKLNIANQEYFNSIKENRNRIEDSKEYMNNSIELKLKSISSEVNDFKDDKICDTLLAGSTEAVSQLSIAQFNAFDGKAFFSTTRNIPGSTAMNNKYTQTGITATTFEADYAGARTQLLDMKDGNGRPYNKNPELVVFVPPALELIAKQLLNQEMTLRSSTGSAISNIYAGDAKVVVNYSLAGSTQYRWYLINAKRKDLAVYQDRENTTWYMEDDNKKNWVGYYYKFRKGTALLNPFSAIRVST
jgi:phage major head subunit gpT-like protein